VSRTASSSGSAFVSRFEVGQIWGTISASPISPISLASFAARIPCPIRSGWRVETTSLGDPVGAALLADVDRDPEPGVARLLDERPQLTVGVGPVRVEARAGDVDADDPARRAADRLLDDDRVLPLGERRKLLLSALETT
jgi:hypothetical protein